jgi:hypothetical protein
VEVARRRRDHDPEPRGDDRPGGARGDRPGAFPLRADRDGDLRERALRGGVDGRQIDGRGRLRARVADAQGVDEGPAPGGGREGPVAEPGAPDPLLLRRGACAERAHLGVHLGEPPPQHLHGPGPLEDGERVGAPVRGIGPDVGDLDALQELRGDRGDLVARGRRRDAELRPGRGEPALRLLGPRGRGHAALEEGGHAGAGARLGGVALVGHPHGGDPALARERPRHAVDPVRPLRGGDGEREEERGHAYLAVRRCT